MKQTPPALPGGAPFVGNALQFMKDRQGLLQKGFNTLGPVFSIKLGTQSAAVLIGPEYQQVFFTETDKKLSMHKSYAFLRAALGEVGFVASPEIYQEQRPILLKPFKSERMALIIPIMQREVQQWLDGLGDQGEINLTQEMNVLVQNVAAHAIMGEKFRNEVGREFWDLYGVLGKALDPVLPPNLPLPKFIRRDQAKQKLRSILLPILAERRAHGDLYDDFLQDFVDARYKDGRPMEDETIVSLILSLMFAGHETTSGQAAWAIIQLLQHPEYQELMRNEIAELYAPGQAIDGRALSSLKHVFWAVQETSRLHPSADMLIRQAEEDIEVGDYIIPKGWTVITSAGTAHKIEEVFANPEAYDPLRFAPGRQEDKQHRFTMIGFGGGVHKCAGMNFANNEMMTIITLLFQQFDLELVTKDPQVVYGVGAARPEATTLRYRRRQLEHKVATESAEQGAAACPHMHQAGEHPTTTATADACPHVATPKESNVQ